MKTLLHSLKIRLLEKKNKGNYPGSVYLGRTTRREQKRSIDAFPSSNSLLAAATVRYKSDILLYKLSKTSHIFFTVTHAYESVYKNSLSFDDSSLSSIFFCVPKRLVNPFTFFSEPPAFLHIRIFSKFEEDYFNIFRDICTQYFTNLVENLVTSSLP